MYADAWGELAKVEAQLEFAKGREADMLRSRQYTLERVLKGEDSQPKDDLIDEWEAQIARGEVPDLNRA